MVTEATLDASVEIDDGLSFASGGCVGDTGVQLQSIAMQPANDKTCRNIFSCIRKKSYLSFLPVSIGLLVSCF